jgi:hypothetical protein
MVFQNLLIGRRRVRSENNNNVVTNQKEDTMDDSNNDQNHHHHHHQLHNQDDDSVEKEGYELKRSICRRLAKKGYTTVGQLLQTSKYVLLVTLDPILTYGTTMRFFLFSSLLFHCFVHAY